MQRIVNPSTIRQGLRFAPSQQRLFSHTPVLRKTLDPNSMSAKDVASELAKAETQKTGTGPVAGGPAATAQSIKDKQGNLADKVHEVAGKAPGDITKEDAAKMQSREDRILGQEARGSNSLASEVQSQADKNASQQ
ncbi:hypothetical protein LIA77_05861 [Sarocladium implicatum]|nr:hypothetical protein LIA77_05861 [Sarocladium implicatum]